MRASQTTAAANPFVSVVVPAYNAESTIGDCIEALLAQSYPRDRYEIIIVDNGSTDGTAEVVGKYPVQYVYWDDVRTSYAARNAGAERARGEALAFCDADQLATPHWLEALLSHWQDPRYAGFCGPCPITARSRGLAERYHALKAADLYNEGEVDRVVPYWGCGNLCVSVDDFRAVGGFAEEQVTGADHRFCLELVEMTGRQILYIADAVQYHRARSSLHSLLKQRFRWMYGYAERREGVPRPRTISQLVVVTAYYWARVPFLATLEAFRAPPEQRDLRVYTVCADAVVSAVDLAARLAYRLGLPPGIAGGM